MPAHTVRYVLPSTAHLPEPEQVVVFLDRDIKVGNLNARLPLEVAVKEADLLAKQIESWNLTLDDEVTPAPITPENIDTFIPSIDIQFLSAKMLGQHGLSKQTIKDLTLYLSAQKKGQKISKSPPLAYILYAYRRKFGISWQQAAETPLSVIMQDFLFSNMEEIFNQ